MIILIESLQDVKKAIGLIIKIFLLILLVLIICTCSTPKLMLGSQTSEKLIDYSLFFGKPANQTSVVMECAILKTVDPVLALCLQQRPSIKLQLLQMHGLGYCPNRVLMLKKCSQIRLSQYLLITPSSSNQSKMGWTDQNQNWRTEYRPQNLPKSPLRKPLKSKY